MLKKTKVIEVREVPRTENSPIGITQLHGQGVDYELTNPVIQQGIRDKAAAENWASRNNHPVVYYIAKKQKVYAERAKAINAVPALANEVCATACSS